VRSRTPRSPDASARNGSRHIQRPAPVKPYRGHPR
jgi:hypothetical protein